MLGLRRGPGGWGKSEGAVAAEEGFLESQARERSRCIPGMLGWRLWGGLKITWGEGEGVKITYRSLF